MYTSTRVRRAVEELAKYYGLSTIMNDVEYIKTAFNVTCPELESFMHSGETYPSVYSFLRLENLVIAEENLPDVDNLDTDTAVMTDTGNQADRDLTGRIIVTPYDTTLIGKKYKYNNAAYWSFFHMGYNEHVKQGWRQAEKTYPDIRHNVMPRDIREAYDLLQKGDQKPREVPVHVVQIYDPMYSPTASDVDIATFLMNGVSTLEWSRCIPHLDITLLDPSAFKGSPGGGDIISKFLAPVGMTAHALYEGEGVATSINASVAGTMEVFTSPQTMIAGDPRAIAMQGGKPFAPLLSVTEFEVYSGGLVPQGKQSVIAGAPAREHKAHLRLLLHDRARLNEIIGYFRPGALSEGSTSIVVSYGWSHPEALPIARRSQDQGPTIGEILNACKTTSVFKCKDVNYNFTESGEVQLEVDLALSSENAIFKKAKLLQASGATSSDLAATLQDVIDFTELMEGKAGASTKLGVGKSFISALRGEMQFDKDVEERLKTFKAQIRAESNFYRSRKVLIGHHAMVNKGYYTHGDPDPNDPGPVLPEHTGYGETYSAFNSLSDAERKNRGATGAYESENFSHLNFTDETDEGGGSGTFAVHTVDAASITAVYDKKSYLDLRFNKYAQLAGIFQKTFEKGSVKNLSAAVVKSNAKSIIKSLIKEVSSGHDPFLRPKPETFPSSVKSCYTETQFTNNGPAKDGPEPKSKNDFVSLGKLVTFFLTPTLQKMEGVAEHQIVFHPFNYDAAGLWNHNIASFPLPVKDVQKKLTDLVADKGNIALADFLGFIFDTYISDNTVQHSHAFGLLGVKDEDRPKRLRLLYGDEETHKKAVPDLRLPNVKFKISEKPVRYYVGESQMRGDATVKSGGERVVRLEIYDEACTANPFQKDVQEANGAAILKKVRKEPNYSIEHIENAGMPGMNRHKYYYDAARDHFLEKKLIVEKGASAEDVDSFVEKVNEKITNDKDHLDKDEFKSLIKSYYYLADEHAYNSQELSAASFDTWENQEGGLKGQIRTEMRKTSQGYIMYGNEGTAIMKCMIQTSQDDAAKDLLLLDVRENEQKSEDDKKNIGRLPVVVVPGELDLEILGNPYVAVGQEYYVHLGTHTNIDGIYTVTSVEHHSEPGEFMTSVKLKPPSQISPRYANAQKELFNFVAAQLGFELSQTQDDSKK